MNPVYKGCRPRIKRISREKITVILCYVFTYIKDFFLNIDDLKRKLLAF